MARILVVDDHPLNRQLLAKLLGYAGHKVVEAADGAQALELAAEQPPDLVITDILMPTMDGYEFVRRMRENAKLAGVPTMFFTATYRESEAQEMARTCGVRHVIAKPVDPAVLMKLVDEVLKSPSAPVPAEAKAHGGEDLGLISDAYHRQSEARQQSALQLAALVEMGIELASQRDPHGLVRFLSRGIRGLVPSRSAAVGFLDADGVTMTHVSTAGLERVSSLAAGQKLDRAIADRWITAEGPVPVRDKAAARALMGLAADAPLPDTFLALPLRLRRHLRGWLALGDRLGREQFSEEDERLLVTFATQAAVSHENARLYAEAQSVAAALEQAESARQGVEVRLEHELSHDAVTGLPNQALLRDRLTQAIAYAERYHQRVGVIALDLDQFKLVNDALGHGAGNGLLREVGACLAACVRKSDTAGRLGGDEFALILTGLATAAEASSAANNVLEALRRGIDVGGRLMRISASIGIAMYPEDGADADTLLQHADAAMYRAKDRGRNNAQCFRPEMTEEAGRRFRIHHQLTRAIDQDELRLYYQPVLDLRSGAISGAEALLRWQNGDRLLTPIHFLEIAESTGLILPIGQWVMATACRQSFLWQDAGYPVDVAVNVSARQFHEPDFVASLKETMGRERCNPARLELEITESMALQNFDETLTALQQVRQMGVRIAVDDFGTGFSSLSYLSRFPVQTVKVDQGFVRKLPGSERDAGIVRTIIDMAHHLGHDVVAEGVETAAQLEFLKQRGCERVQGFLFSPAVPPQDFGRMLKAGKALAA
jgi:diguanylate cyclase (GGDEF)-like protein